ncbi:MAG: anti-sigma factor [Vicinamibacterales bacterium]
MSECSHIDPIVTPYVDGELPAAERDAVDRHLATCGACRTRVAAERSVHELLGARRANLCAMPAPPDLEARCRQTSPRSVPDRVPVPHPASFPAWRSRALPIAIAAMLLIVLAGGAIYRLTQTSVRVMAAELTADHVRCFMLYASPDSPPADPRVVEQSLASSFDWNATLPANPEQAGLKLIGARPCLYAQGRVAHIMYTYEGRPVSVFMLPDSQRAQDLFDIMNHRAVAWTSEDRTFVLVASEPPETMDRIMRFVHAGLH